MAETWKATASVYDDRMEDVYNEYLGRWVKAWICFIPLNVVAQKPRIQPDFVDFYSRVYILSFFRHQCVFSAFQPSFLPVRCVDEYPPILVL